MLNGVTLEKLTVGYNSPVVSQVDLQVNPGEIVALIGPNGAGKSTVLKTITRQLKKLDGHIYISGSNEETLSEEELAKQLSMVTTERIHPELMTGYDVVATGRFPYTGRMGFLSQEDVKIVKTAIDMVGANDVADSDFMKISDGQRQRIMLARAIAQEPDIMVLDEPTSFLDIQYKLDILGIIKRLAKSKKMAVIMSIHELEFVPAVADVVVAVSQGKTMYIGTPEETITPEQMEKIYHMKKGSGEVLVSGLWSYGENLKKLLEE